MERVICVENAEEFLAAAFCPVEEGEFLIEAPPGVGESLGFTDPEPRTPRRVEANRRDRVRGMPALLVALAVVAWIQPGLIKAQSNLENRLNRIKLYNHCRPMELLVESPSASATAEGITEELLRWAGESRLRAARLYTDSSTDAGSTILYIRGDLFHQTFGKSIVELWVDYLKVAYDPESGKETARSIWSKKFRRHVEFRFQKTVREELPKLVDQFLVEYLRVNEKDCPR